MLAVVAVLAALGFGTAGRNWLTTTLPETRQGSVDKTARQLRQIERQFRRNGRASRKQILESRRQARQSGRRSREARERLRRSRPPSR